MTTTILLTECEQHPWATLIPTTVSVPRIRKIGGEYVRVAYAGDCPECDRNVRESYRKGEL